ncbi:MAG: 50S ribosomal protein L29 [Candidatus Peregrinibacteria bacterium]|nr:50S ribosomal protein L29 [Candidatus Peregrinibacteria bacterium]
MLSSQEIKSLTKKEVLKELEAAREEVMKRRITVKTKHEKDTSSISKLKRQVARLKTALKEIELEEMVESSKKIEA